MKYIITESKLEQFIMNYFDEYYKDVKFYHEKEGEISIDDLDNPYLCVIDFNIGYDPMYINFEYLKECSKRHYNRHLQHETPKLVMYSEVDVNTFNSYFENLWHKPFVKWFENTFELEVNTFIP